MINVERIQQLHATEVARWHEAPVDNPYEGLEAIVCQQFAFNFQLWHEEDIARSPDVGDERIAAVKRAIDKLNQQRNDWIEKIDDWITADLQQRQVTPAPDATQNTETPGSAIDRMSIMALRIYHMLEQLERTDATDEHRDKVGQKLAICREQLQDLGRSTQQLLELIYGGQRVHKTYRQFKMYNDPTLNPYLYARPESPAKVA